MVFRYALGNFEKVFLEMLQNKKVGCEKCVSTSWTRLLEFDKIKLLRGWSRIDNGRGFLNETTEQNIVVTKKPLGQHFIVLLFPAIKAKAETEGRKVSPEFPAEAKATALRCRVDVQSSVRRE